MNDGGVGITALFWALLGTTGWLMLILIYVGLPLLIVNGLVRRHMIRKHEEVTEDNVKAEFAKRHKILRFLEKWFWPTVLLGCLVMFIFTTIGIF